MKQFVCVVFLLVGVVLLSPQVSKAAPPDPDCDPLDPACPIDGGVTILLAAGIGLGVKRALKKNQQD